MIVVFICCSSGSTLYPHDVRKQINIANVCFDIRWDASVNRKLCGAHNVSSAVNSSIAMQKTHIHTQRQPLKCLYSKDYFY